MPAPQRVLDLVEQFRRNAEEYRNPQYNETQVRREFIDPLFEALGWDVNSTKDFDQTFREVVHEDEIKVGGATKAPDYSFRIGGSRLFFLEAKKPSLNLKEDPSPAYQLRRYGWTAKLPVSILTNFEEFVAYDTRIGPPKPTDKPGQARVLYLRCDEYAERWDEIAGLFSPQAIQQGALRRFTEATTRKRGAVEVDDAFLAEIEQWREVLARNLAARNPQLEQRDLNRAVQTTLDRIIFLRICEDRGIEDYGRLQALQNGENLYARLMQLFREADLRYNSGLFHFEQERGRPEPPDELTPGLSVDGKVLRGILKRLYYPDSPYEFSVFPAEILGQIYERFLGSAIRLTPGHRAKVEQKPEVRKTGGVYYTPAYIVEYIVKYTVGKLLEGRSPHEASGLSDAGRPTKAGRPLTVLDPACGSGAFLLGAYQYLLDWYLRRYIEEPGRWSRGRGPRLYQHRAGDWRLTTAERRRILLTHIYGVDIDPAAVEVTKLSLLLKVLEGESAETLEGQLLFHKERALPDLAANIKCGNSLIGPDYFNGRQMGMFDQEDLYRVNAFCWKSEFKEIIASGGFDAVIGNPPWGQKGVDLQPADIEYIRARFASAKGILDLFRPFVEMAILRACEGGRWGFVLPDIVLLKDYPSTRRFILDQVALSDIAFWGMAFKDAVIDAVAMVGTRTESAARRRASHVKILISDPRHGHRTRMIPQLDFARDDECKFNLFTSQEGKALVSRLAGLPNLRDFLEIHEGVHSGNVRDKIFVNRKKNRYCRPMILGRDEVARYRLSWNGMYLNCAPGIVDRDAGEYANFGHKEWYEQDKLIVRRTGDRLVCALDKEGFFFSNNVFVLPAKQDCALDLPFLLGLLNSRFLTWYYLAVQPRKGRVFSEVKIKHIGRFPVPFARPTRPGQAERYGRLISLVQRMMQLYDRLGEIKRPHERRLIECQIEAADHEIDRLVYEFYELSDEEIALVERASEA